ncbi:DNA repair protein RecN [Corallibacter vietnamensis]|uniref:DNA repair protein RecN n=1 Tax=Corallibacter vietnamensis TaxID=904130 RepID=A0ABP7HGM7_9FLAO
MLTSLSIKNYALIDHFQVQFNQGLTIITGETGAGKSILLGGLSLILGKRADLNSLKNPEKKCVIEAVFDVTNYDLKQLFKTEDLDYEPQTIIRREILPSGKSRAFVNDSPVNLNSLQALSSHLIDIHSQHETLQLVNDDFQFQVIDALAKNASFLTSYKQELTQYKSVQKALTDLQQFKAEAIKEYDYNTFLLNELEEANLVEGELQELEEEYEALQNVEEIEEKLALANQLLNDEQVGALAILAELKQATQKLSTLSVKYETLFQRVSSSLIELDDVFADIETYQETLDSDPSRLQYVNDKLAVINALFKKHFVESISELLVIKNNLSEKVSETENIEGSIVDKEKELQVIEDKLNKLSKTIHDNRNKAIPELKKQLESILSLLGMPNAQFDIRVTYEEAFLGNGKDVLSFLFSANKGGHFNELKKAASGGELSRIMLAIKSILSKYMQLPTIMFDEIDSGVSGEVSNKMGQIMLQMSQTMQVFAITHLPQIAAKGHTHFKVYKEDVNNITTTNLTQLNHDERIIEIAQMLGGIEISNSAIAHAKQLLN